MCHCVRVFSRRYLFGEKVNGHAFVVFGVITEDKGKISLPGSLQRVMVLLLAVSFKDKYINILICLLNIVIYGYLF